MNSCRPAQLHKQQHANLAISSRVSHPVEQNCHHHLSISTVPRLAIYLFDCSSRTMFLSSSQSMNHEQRFRFRLFGTVNPMFCWTESSFALVLAVPFSW
ncbi:hypothetical protein HZ326_18921 [Fusarium oxysporum f. sp. albedinis]|nr:hypothetical protein HZ326_18921 [Fusarium oxysporum f. sp. albedinis]